MAQLDLTQQQALLLTKILGGTLQHSGSLLELPEVSALYAALGALEFPRKACVVCGTAFDAKNPRRTTCSARCRQALSRSKRAAPAHATPGGHAEDLRPDPVPVTPPPDGAESAPPSQPDRDESRADLHSSLEDRRREIAAHWELCQSDAKRHRFTAKAVQRFRIDHRLGFDSPLSPEAAQQLREELELRNRVASGEAIAAQKRLAAYEQLLTPGNCEAVANLVTELPSMDTHAWQYRWKPAASDYLKRAKESLPATAFRQFQQLAGEGPGTRSLRNLYLGCLLRLPDLPMPIPTNPAAFVEWSGLVLLLEHRRRSDNFVADLMDLKQGRMKDGEARALLELPVGVPLSENAVRSAYRALAQQHHPDAGGDAARFQRLTEARDRLMLTTTVTVRP